MLNPSAFKIPPEQCTLSTCGLEEAQIDYIPSLPGNAAFLAIFVVLLVIHTVQGIRYRTWGVLIGIAAGLILEVIGYVGRIQMHFNPFKSAHFTMSVLNTPLDQVHQIYEPNAHTCQLYLGSSFVSPSLQLSSRRPSTFA
jgi:hypothetical protein